MRAPREPKVATIALVSASLLLVSGIPAAQAAGEYRVQRDLMVQAADEAARAGAGAVLIRDMTGRLGDVYTFLPPTLETALRTRGQHFAATICTPADVSRNHPVAERLRIGTTPTCDEAASPGTLALDADWAGDGDTIVLTRAR